MARGVDPKTLQRYGQTRITKAIFGEEAVHGTSKKCDTWARAVRGKQRCIDNVKILKDCPDNWYQHRPCRSRLWELPCQLLWRTIAANCKDCGERLRELVFCICALENLLQPVPQPTVLHHSRAMPWSSQNFLGTSHDKESCQNEDDDKCVHD